MNPLLALLLSSLTMATNVTGSASADAATNVTAGVSTPENAKITSASVYYDRKEGFAYFSGNVFVDDTKYKLHADRAYVFMSGTNDVRRIVALGHVAMTNETKRAYGDKASYYRDPGKVILTAADGAAAEVRDEAPDGTKVIRGRKIVFWTNSRQVEVLEAEIAVPSKGLKDNPLSRMK